MRAIAPAITVLLPFVIGVGFAAISMCSFFGLFYRTGRMLGLWGCSTASAALRGYQKDTDAKQNDYADMYAQIAQR